MDVADVLRRWGAARAARAGARADAARSRPSHARRSGCGSPTLLGIDPTRCDASGSEANESLGVVEVELLRRVNADLEGFRRPVDRGVWIRGYLAQGKLVPRKGEKFWPSPDRVEELRARGDRAVDAIVAGGYDVIGDVEDLRTPSDVPPRRHPDSVTDAELVEAASATIAAMLTDVRRLTNERRRHLPRRSLVRKAAGRARGLWHRSQTR